MGFSPNSGGVSLRTFNRNFLGRSGTKDGQVYLVSPETAVAAALTGYITDPTTFTEPLEVTMPDTFLVNDSAVLAPVPVEEADKAEVLRGPNIKEFPKSKAFSDELTAQLVLKVGDNITTDHIMPAGAKILPYRSNIPFLSKFCFEVCDPTFAERAKAAGDGIIVGGSNYGQGSSREHAALVPMYLGVRCVIAKSFARIHVANLINAGILPVTFANPDDYDKLNQDPKLTISNIVKGMEEGKLTVTDEKGFVKYFSKYGSHFSGEQLDWFANVALNFDDKEEKDWGVILTFHMFPENFGYHLDSNEAFLGICSAFKEAKKYSCELLQEDNSFFDIKVDADFSRYADLSQKPHFICMLLGHDHEDKNTQVCGINVIWSLNSSASSLYGDARVMRYPGTATQNAFDILNIDTKCRKIRMFRYGAGLSCYGVGGDRFLPDGLDY
jgi:3-isopropylmalate dehydratase small subunit